MCLTLPLAKLCLERDLGESHSVQFDTGAHTATALQALAMHLRGSNFKTETSNFQTQTFVSQT